MKIRIPKILKNSLLFIAIFIVGVTVGNQYFRFTQNTPQILSEKNTPKAFISEVYDKIKENYWNNISDAEILNLFKTAIEKNGNTVLVLKLGSKDKLLEAMANTSKGMDNEKMNSFYVAVTSAVLNSLSPLGRSGLYTQKDQEQLTNTVANINPQKDLYKDLGINKEASDEAIQQAYKEKSQELAKDKSPESQEKLKQLNYARNTLTKKETKENYDKLKIEPTIFAKPISPNILYVQFKKFSPTSLEEFQRAFESYKDADYSALILDLRGNIGGAIDATAYLMGFFLGKNQYAFDFYHKGEYIPFKTPTDKLPSVAKYKQVAVLVDQNTQSSAEMLAASLKKYRIGVILGIPTKGWGTVEKVFPLENQISQKEKYSLFLAHSITLRDDNLPIEGRGVEPDINITDPNWKQKFLSYFNNQKLLETIENHHQP